MTVVAAVDLGASSGRVLVGRFGAEPATLIEVHRFPNEPVRAGGVLYWDVLALYRGVLEGLRKADAEYGPLDSVGVDTWAVDYGVIDADGRLLGNPIHYRDAGTEAAIGAVHDKIGDLYDATGIQHLPFNTVFQLSARPPARGTTLLIPDLINFWLSGVRGTEITNASTTALIDPRTRDWAEAVFDKLDLANTFPPLHEPGTVLGPVLPEVGLRGTPTVIAVPSHDTAAAVAGVPADGSGFAYVCTGTWSLVGVELPAPVVTDAGRAANFTNELGADGTVRYLRNVTGFWLLQECEREWGPLDLDALFAEAAQVPAGRALIDVQDPGFAEPGDMPARIAAAASAPVASRAEIVRCILDSMSSAIRNTVQDAVRLAGRPVTVIHLVGGGAVNPLFCQLVADACGLPVIAGPKEAASWGNAVTQGQALGAVEPGLAAGRAVIAAAESPVRYEPS
jgi:rhamnulokinase